MVWVSDFGLAKVDDDALTRTGDILGTIRYMAPERFRGQGDARADLYSLGLTLYEVLTLRPAFDVARPSGADPSRSRPSIRPVRGRSTPHPPRPGDDRPQSRRQGSSGPLHDGRGDDRGPAAVPQ